MSRTVSARIPSELHEELRERCNLIGESINDFVKAAIEFALYGCVEFDFGDVAEKPIEQERSESREKPNTQSCSQYISHTSHPDIKLVREIAYDGQTAYIDTNGYKWLMKPDRTLIPIARVVRTISEEEMS
jgi:hypothetical protein